MQTPRRTSRGASIPAALLLALCLAVGVAVAGSSDAVARDGVRHPSVLYTGRGDEIKNVSFRLQGHRLIEASLVVIERCTRTGGGHRRRYHWRAELEEASPRFPLRVDRHGHFRSYRSDVEWSSDEFLEFVGNVTPDAIVGTFTSRSSESAPESGIFYTCQTGGFPGTPRRVLSYRAVRGE